MYLQQHKATTKQPALVESRTSHNQAENIFNQRAYRSSTLFVSYCISD